MAGRPFIVSLGWTLRDYAKRVWDNSGEDNVLFLAGGIAFNLILAALPFILLLINGVTYLLPLFVHNLPASSTATGTVRDFIDRMLPAHEEGGAGIDGLLNDLLRTRGSITIY